jgi:hypothetical protein
MLVTDKTLFRVQLVFSRLSDKSVSANNTLVRTIFTLLNFESLRVGRLVAMVIYQQQQ